MGRQLLARMWELMDLLSEAEVEEAARELAERISKGQA